MKMPHLRGSLSFWKPNSLLKYMPQPSMLSRKNLIRYSWPTQHLIDHQTSENTSMLPDMSFSFMMNRNRSFETLLLIWDYWTLSSLSKWPIQTGNNTSRSTHWHELSSMESSYDWQSTRKRWVQSEVLNAKGSSWCPRLVSLIPVTAIQDPHK